MKTLKLAVLALLLIQVLGFKSIHAKNKDCTGPDCHIVSAPDLR